MIVINTGTKIESSKLSLLTVVASKPSEYRTSGGRVHANSTITNIPTQPVTSLQFDMISNCLLAVIYMLVVVKSF